MQRTACIESFLKYLSENLIINMENITSEPQVRSRKKTLNREVSSEQNIESEAMCVE